MYEREGVEEQVAEAAVQESVGEDLPGQEADEAAVADRMLAQRPQRQVAHHLFGQQVLQQESRAHGPEQAGGDRWHAHAWRFPCGPARIIARCVPPPRSCTATRRWTRWRPTCAFATGPRWPSTRAIRCWWRPRRRRAAHQRTLRLRPASTGRDDGRTPAGLAATTRCGWTTRPAARRPATCCWRWTGCASALNRRLTLGLASVEAHFAHYPRRRRLRAPPRPLPQRRCARAVAGALSQPRTGRPAPAANCACTCPKARTTSRRAWARWCCS